MANRSCFTTHSVKENSHATLHLPRLGAGGSGARGGRSRLGRVRAGQRRDARRRRRRPRRWTRCSRPVSTAGCPASPSASSAAARSSSTGPPGSPASNSETPLAPTDRFRIYSITKTFTAVLVLQLVDEGVLTLDDTVSQWLDDPVVGRIPNVDRITLRQLLTHTSGVYDYFDDDSPFWQDAYFGEGADWTRVWTPQELLAYADGAKPRALLRARARASTTPTPATSCSA